MTKQSVITIGASVTKPFFNVGSTEESHLQVRHILLIFEHLDALTGLGLYDLSDRVREVGQ